MADKTKVLNFLDILDFRAGFEETAKHLLLSSSVDGQPSEDSTEEYALHRNSIVEKLIAFYAHYFEARFTNDELDQLIKMRLHPLHQKFLRLSDQAHQLAADLTDDIYHELVEKVGKKKEDKDTPVTRH